MTSTSPPRSSPPPAGGGESSPWHAHAAAVVASDAEWLATALPFIEAGLRAGDLVVLACPDDRMALVAAALGQQAALVRHEPGISLLGARPPDALARCRRYVEDAAGTGSGRVRVLADVDFGGEPADWREGQRFESVVNRILSGAPVTVCCLYDERRLPAPVVRSAAATHPVLVRGVQRRPSRAYQEPEAFVPALPLPREPVEDGEPVAVIEDAPGLAVLRRRIRESLAAWVPDHDQREDLHLGFAEIAANAFRHGAPPVSVRVWSDGARIVCTVSDGGTSPLDPLCGFVPAHGQDLSRGGMGLWLARKLWDHVDVLPGRDGLTVRLSTRLRAAG
jgi:anti-sigma regulatory factor (Ser/Thr protein kinase)